MNWQTKAQAARAFSRAGTLMHNVVSVYQRGQEITPELRASIAETEKQAKEIACDGLRLLGIPVPGAPTNADKRPGDNCVSCTFKSAGLDELSLKQPCETCGGEQRIGGDIPCPKCGDHLNSDPVMTMPRGPREGGGQ